jgi:Flp pilus assembly protein TadD
MPRFLLNLISVLLVSSLTGAGAHANAESWSPPRDSQSADYEQGMKAVGKQDWQAALESFTKAAASEPANANVFNMLAYAYRKSGKLDMAFKHYQEALRLDPEHRGAHEYIGEAYLMANNLAKAEEHLKILDKLCFLPCEAYTDLNKAVADYKAKQAK